MSHFLRVPDRFGKDLWINVDHIIAFWDGGGGEQSGSVIPDQACWIELTGRREPVRAGISAAALAISIKKGPQ